MAIKLFDPETYRANEAYAPYYGNRRLLRVDAVCIDGIVRRAVLAPEPDTYFSIPASVRVAGKTVTGFIMSDDNYGDATLPVVYRFLANL